MEADHGPSRQNRYVFTGLPTSLSSCGHFNLPLQILAGETTDESLRQKYASISKFLEDEVGPMRNAIFNMLGVIAYQRKDESKAREHFDQVLQTDPRNLNALANMAFVYRNADQNEEGKDKEKFALSIISEVATKDDQKSEILESFVASEDKADENRSIPLIRCVAELAYCLAYDCFNETEKLPPCTAESDQMFEYVLSRSKTVKCLVEERKKWQFHKAINLYHKWRKQIENLENNFLSEELRTSLTVMLQLLREVTTGRHDRLYISDSWCYIGMLLYDGKKLINDGDPVLRNCLWKLKISHFFDNPEKCFEAVCNLQNAANPWRVLAKFGKYMGLGNKRYCEGLSITNKSLTLNPDPLTNWFAYETRAMIHLGLYREEIRRSRNGLGDKDMLLLAERDLRSCLEVRSFDPWILGAMAEVQLFLGT